MKYKEPLVCFQGSVKQVNVICTENPFFLNADCNVAYRKPDNVIMKLHYGWFNGMTEGSAKAIVEGMNVAFRLGYETNRFEWKEI